MSKDGHGVPGGGRLWSTREREPLPHSDEKILPMKSAVPAERPAPNLADRTYTAFEVRDRAERLQIVRSAGPSRFPNYNYLLDISFDHHLQSAFTLIYTFMIVEVTGCDLGPVVHAINYGTCECIREYSPKLLDVPVPGKPLIQKIQITSADEKLTKQSA